MQVITYGGIVTRLLVPDRRGRLADVVLGFDALAPYLSGHPYFGAIAGRVAGRITAGRFVLGHEAVQLALNDPPNHLHGGWVGFDKQLWTAEPLTRADGPSSLRLSLRSADGDEGYPGNLDAAVTFTLTDQNEFRFETEVATDRPTPVGLTHHSYFNLAGEAGGPITGHEFQIFADAYAPTDQSMTLLGRRAAVDGQDGDFRRARRLSDALPGIFGAHGDLYFLRDAATDGVTNPVPAARVREPISGRVLDVRTTERCLQFYTGVSLDGRLRGKSGVPYARHHGFCLECEEYPDAVNHPALGDLIVHPGKPRRHTTVYAFSAG